MPGVRGVRGSRAARFASGGAAKRRAQTAGARAGPASSPPRAPCAPPLPAIVLRVHTAHLCGAALGPGPHRLALGVVVAAGLAAVRSLASHSGGLAIDHRRDACLARGNVLRRWPARTRHEQACDGRRCCRVLWTRRAPRQRHHRWQGVPHPGGRRVRLHRAGHGPQGVHPCRHARRRAPQEGGSAPCAPGPTARCVAGRSWPPRSGLARLPSEGGQAGMQLAQPPGSLSRSGPPLAPRRP